MLKTSELRLTTNLGLLSFFELLQAIDDGKPVELLRMQAFQRAPIVTALAITMHVIRRYAVTQPVDWESEWLRQVGDLPVVDGPLDEPGFFQVPFNPATDVYKSVDVISVNPTIAGINHEYKTKEHCTVEDYVLALLSSHWRSYVRQFAATTGRGSLTVVLPSIDGSLGSEVATLEFAYAQHASAVVVAGVRAKSASAADHFLWLHPWANKTPIDLIPYPYMTPRPMRITVDGMIALYRDAYECRISGDRVHAEDPHVPLLNGEPLRLTGLRAYDIRYQHACLFGAPSYGSQKQIAVPAPVLALTQSRFVRICAHSKDKSSTRGYWESGYALATTQRRSIFQNASDRTTEISTRALAALRAAESAIKSALFVLLDVNDVSPRRSVDKGIIRAACAECSANTSVEMTQTVLDLLAKPEDSENEQAQLSAIAAASARAVFNKYADAYDDILRSAKAQIKFDYEIRLLDGGYAMTPDRKIGTASGSAGGGLADLETTIFSIMLSLQSQITLQDRASLRSMDQISPPLLYWTLLARVPAQQADTPEVERVWRAIIPALGVIYAGQASLGRTLFDVGFPRSRLQQLLTATGDRLVELMTETVRWLISHEIESCNIATLCALGVADALGDRPFVTACRKRIAMDYVRAESASKRVAQRAADAADSDGV